MIRSDVEQDRHLWPEGFHIFQLETTQFTHIPFCSALCEEVTKPFTHITHFSGIDPCCMQEVMTQAGRGGFTITSGDPDDTAIRIAVGPLDLADDFLACIRKCLQDLTVIRDPWALDDDITRHQSFKMMSLFFKRDLMLIQYFFSLRLDLHAITHPHFMSP